MAWDNRKAFGGAARLRRCYGVRALPAGYADLVADVASCPTTVCRVSLLDLVINHASFAQTNENLFTLAFLVRDNKVGFEVGDGDKCRTVKGGWRVNCSGAGQRTVCCAYQQRLVQGTTTVRRACCLTFQMLFPNRHVHCWHRVLLLLVLLVQEDEEEGLMVLQRLPGKQEPK